MDTTATIRDRAEADLEAEAEAVLAEHGLTPAEAITLFYRQIVRERGLPFPLQLPEGSSRGSVEGTPADPPHQTARQAEAVPSFLAEASRILANSLDYETTVAAVAGLSLPHLGAWCIVDLCTDGEVRRAAIIHVDPAMQAMARMLESNWPPERDDPFGVPRVMRTRETETIPDIPDEVLVEVSRSDENLRVLRALGMGSLLVVPLLARGMVLGAITYVSPRGGNANGGENVALAEDLASRCAIALDNARLYHESQEAQGARRMAEEASAAKTQFLAIMSHELRTPLTSVIAYAELLETERFGPMAARQQEACARIRTSSLHLVSIIDEVLLFAKAEAGQLEVRSQKTDVAELAREVVQIVEAGAERPEIALRFQCASAPPALWTDPGKLRQILLNLVGNAAKYTKAGEITVTVEHDRSASEGLRIQVRDTGPGIAPEAQERIFEPFTQVDGSLTRAFGGTGLGLSVSLTLARLLGGDIALQSTPGEGSTFSLHLPSGAEAPR